MLKVGQRVKKARGDMNVGVTGVVVRVGYWPKGDPDGRGNIYNRDYDMGVQVDSPYTSEIGGGMIPRGNEVAALQSEWEPIVPGGSEPSRYSYEELMDKFIVTNPDESRELVLIEEKVR